VAEMLSLPRFFLTLDTIDTMRLEGHLKLCFISHYKLTIM